MQDTERAKTAKQELRTLDKKERSKQAERAFIKAAAEADHIPLRNKTQYPFYVEAKTLHLMRAIAEVDGISVQELIRNQMDVVINRRVYSKVPKKKVSKSRRAS